VIPIRDINASPRRTFPFVNVLLIALNGLVFLFELSLGPRLEGFLMAAAFVPARAFGGGASGAGALGALVPGLASALVSMFLHGGWGHLLGNMLFLWIFGDNVEDRLGHFRYLLFYLLCGYAATYAHAFFNAGSTMPAIGASGAISGVLGAYLFLFPRARIVTLVWLFIFIRFIEIPVLVYLPLWFLMQFFSGLSSLRAADPAAGGGVAWFAHVGGFIAGPLLLLLLGGARRRAPSARSPW
jgi:membrane associated rhomboid family serine protease